MLTLIFEFLTIQRSDIDLVLSIFITVFLSFLKRDHERLNVNRERFPLFVPKRYCVTTRTFLDVLDRSTSLTVQRP